MTQLDPHSYVDPDQGRITHADLDVTIDFDAKQLKGTVTLVLDEPRQGVLDLDTRALTIEGVTAACGELDFDLGESDPVLGARLRIHLREPVTEVRVRYATSPGASALQWLTPQNTAGGKHPYLFSQCQPHHARSMVPLQDSAIIRFTYRAAITVPSPLVAVMSAAPGVEEAGPSPDTTTYAFEMPQPIPAYLLALAVGNIAARDIGPRTRVYAEPEVLEAAAWEFAEAEQMLIAAEKLFGPFRWDRYDFLVMPPAFPYGGMENPRLTFLTPTLIAGDRSLANVLAHELAHSWTGNLVTNATMNDFWLNEGFTVWAERRIHEALLGKEAVAMAAAIGRDDLQEDIDRFGVDSPYLRLKNDLAGVDPDDIYSTVPYEKGFLLVALLEKTVGREAFDGFMRDYTDHFAFTSITTEEFLEFLEERLPGVAEKARAKQWIYEAGIPDNAPVFESQRLEELRALASGWDEGARPAVSEAKQWSVAEWQVFLGGLPKKLSIEACTWLDESFALSQSGNAEILCKWLVLAATAGYAPAYSKMRAFLGEVGRMKFLKPLYKALADGDATRPLALEIFAACADKYHPIARTGLERLLAPAS